MAKILDLIYRVTDKATPGIKKIKTEQDSLTSAVKRGAVVAGAATVAFAAAKKVWESSITPLIEYNKAMSDTADAIGMGTEELSRLVQVGDDVGVSMEAMEGAFKLATKNGFQPTTASLADLADKTEAMGSSTEKAAYLSKIFGRNWAAINPILELGGQKIREMSAGVEDGLVVTQKSLEQTEQLRLNLDELNDSYVAVRNTVALGVVTAVNENIRVTRLLNSTINMEAKPTLIEYIKQWHLFEEAIRQNVAEVGFLANKINSLQDKTITVTVNSVELAQSQATHPSEKRDDGYYWIWNGKEMVRGNRWSTNEPRGGRAAGGPVGAGGSYMVGERGPEMFTPGQSGKVSSNNDLAALTKSINRMVATLPVILRDAVQKS